MFDLTNKKALITGSSQGIGLEMAKLFANQGAKVFVHGSNEEKCVSATKDVLNATSVCCDLQRQDCAENIYDATGDVDILVLNASVQVRKPYLEISDEDIDLQVDVNFKSSIKLIQKYVPYMINKKWGRILFIGSVQQNKPNKDMLVYSALKSAQVNMAKSLAKQLAPYNITVNNLAPGVILTPRNYEALADEEYKKKILEGIPCGYAGIPQDCASACLLLCSEEGRYITGADLLADGGMSL